MYFMKTVSKIMIACAALLLGLTFIAPLWKISLWAPQYPEGLVLKIWTSKFSGDVQTVNILNHYIGMKPITEANFPELQYFPKIFGFLMALGLAVAILGKRMGAYFYSLVLVCFSVWAMYDFYNWEAKFAADLNPDAAIKMEEMVYQPPLIGEKTLLNIVVSSWPDIAGYAMVLSVLLVIGVSLLEFKDRKKLASAVAPALLVFF